VAKAFSRFYHDCPTLALAQENGQLAAARLFLATCTRQVLENGLDLILVPFLETM
jgi:arginyl-tRNA synthetase